MRTGGAGPCPCSSPPASVRTARSSSRCWRGSEFRGQWDGRAANPRASRRIRPTATVRSAAICDVAASRSRSRRSLTLGPCACAKAHAAGGHPGSTPGGTRSAILPSSGRSTGSSSSAPSRPGTRSAATSISARRRWPRSSSGFDHDATVVRRTRKPVVPGAARVRS